MKKILAIFLLMAALGIPSLARAQENEEPRAASNNSEKLDKILEELEEIKSELQIIKVRASMR